MSVFRMAEDILQLARSRETADRERLLMAVVELCDSAGQRSAVGAASVQELLSSVLMNLVVEAERDVRRLLAEKLARSDWVPSSLINVLALDDIEIARPVIALSPILRNADLVRLLVEATIEHQIEVARRPSLGAPVVAAILKRREPAVLAALAGNVSAELSAEDMAQLVEASRRITALRRPLSRHPKLTDELARELYTWVGQSIRQALAARFELDMAALDAALGDAVRQAHGGLRLEMVWSREGEQEEMERRLLAKLDVAGQLRPGYLMRALREGKLSLFVGALATLGRFEPAQVRQAVNSEQPELLALACAAVGIDRSVFPTILDMVRKLNGQRPGGGGEGQRRAIGAFGPFAPDIARAAFRQAMAAA